MIKKLSMEPRDETVKTIDEYKLEELKSISAALTALYETLEEIKKSVAGIDYTLERSFEFYKAKILDKD